MLKKLFKTSVEKLTNITEDIYQGAKEAYYLDRVIVGGCRDKHKKAADNKNKRKFLNAQKSQGEQVSQSEQVTITDLGADTEVDSSGTADRDAVVVGDVNENTEKPDVAIEPEVTINKAKTVKRTIVYDKADGSVALAEELLRALRNLTSERGDVVFTRESSRFYTWYRSIAAYLGSSYDTFVGLVRDCFTGFSVKELILGLIDIASTVVFGFNTNQIVDLSHIETIDITTDKIAVEREQFAKEYKLEKRGEEKGVFYNYSLNFFGGIFWLLRRLNPLHYIRGEGETSGGIRQQIFGYFITRSDSFVKLFVTLFHKINKLTVSVFLTIAHRFFTFSIGVCIGIVNFVRDSNIKNHNVDSCVKEAELKITEFLIAAKGFFSKSVEGEILVDLRFITGRFFATLHSIFHLIVSYYRGDIRGGGITDFFRAVVDWFLALFDDIILGSRACFTAWSHFSGSFSSFSIGGIAKRFIRGGSHAVGVTDTEAEKSFGLFTGIKDKIIDSVFDDITKRITRIPKKFCSASLNWLNLFTRRLFVLFFQILSLPYRVLQYVFYPVIWFTEITSELFFGFIRHVNPLLFKFIRSVYCYYVPISFIRTTAFIREHGGTVVIREPLISRKFVKKEGSKSTIVSLDLNFVTEKISLGLTTICFRRTEIGVSSLSNTAISYTPTVTWPIRAALSMVVPLRPLTIMLIGGLTLLRLTAVRTVYLTVSSLTASKPARTPSSSKTSSKH